jgi:hypothetical protein
VPEAGPAGPSKIEALRDRGGGGRPAGAYVVSSPPAVPVLAADGYGRWGMPCLRILE